VENKPLIYTDDQLMARLKFFIGVCLALTLTGIVFVVLYSLIFVTQPLNAISPIDQKFFELIVPIATFLTGTLSGIMLAGSKKEDQDAFLAAQKQAQANFESAKTPTIPTQMQRPMMQTSMGMMGGMPTVMRQEPAFDMYGSAPQVVTGFGGKLAPPPAPQPLI
jgi:hypothetical protein